jgi:hypothetical protein
MRRHRGRDSHGRAKVLGEAVEDEDSAGDLEPRERRAAVLEQHVRRGRRPLPQGHEGHGLLAVHRIRPADDGRFEDVGWEYRTASISFG